MILTKDEIQTITLNAKFVHKYADQVFFTSELNNAPERIKDQPFLNFFVRYHHRDAPERYSWSRVRRVLLLEDAIAAAQKTGATPPAASSTVEWRGKTFWVCLAVEPVQLGGGARATNVDAPAAEEELVALTQLSNTVPEDEEVLAFCVASANRRPTEKYDDGVLGEAPADVVVDTPTYDNGADNADHLPDDEAHTATDTDVPDLTPPLNPRVFVPTPRQVELLRQYKKQHFTHHQWSEDEIEASKQLRLRYSGIGVAAAPVRTVAYMHEHRVVARRQRAAAAPASPVEALLGDAEVTPDPLSQQATDSIPLMDGDATQTQRSTRSAIPPSSPSTVSNSDAPLSPFLPRGVLRHQQQLQGSVNAVFAPRAASNAETGHSANASLLGAGSSTSSLSHMPVSQTPPLSQDSPGTPADASTRSPQSVESLSALSQHLSQLRAAEDSFYKYVSDEKRSHYLNRLANITLRNSETNAHNRRRGIANERRLERRGNLLESRGLWITDDKERAKQAEVYVKEASASASDAKEKADKAPTAAAAAGGAAGENTSSATNVEEVFVEKFKAYHNAQHISFSDCADDLLSGTDADVESIVRAAAATAADASAPSSAEDGGASRGNRRAVRRLLPNRLNTEEASPLSVQAQLVHRSTLRMAKRARDE